MQWKHEGSMAVSGVFRNRDHLEAVLDELEMKDLRQDTSVLMSDKTRDYYRDDLGYDDTVAQTLPAATGAGAVTGGVLGAIIGGLSTVGTVLLPGTGLLIAGPLFGALAGGALGAATGGLIGALVGAGVPEEEARHYERALGERGVVLLVSHVEPHQVGMVKAIFNEHGAEMVHAY